MTLERQSCPLTCWRRMPTSTPKRPNFLLQQFGEMGES